MYDLKYKILIFLFCNIDIILFYFNILYIKIFLIIVIVNVYLMYYKLIIVKVENMEII